MGRMKEEKKFLLQVRKQIKVWYLVKTRESHKLSLEKGCVSFCRISVCLRNERHKVPLKVRMRVEELFKVYTRGRRTAPPPTILFPALTRVCLRLV